MQKRCEQKDGYNTKRAGINHQELTDAVRDKNLIPDAEEKKEDLKAIAGVRTVSINRKLPYAMPQLLRYRQIYNAKL